MTTNSRRLRGRRTEHIVTEYFKQFWGNAKVVNSGASGSDVLGTPFFIEVRARSKFNPLEWVKSVKAREQNQLGFVVMRCNGQGETAEDYVFIARLGDMMPLLEDKVPTDEIARCKGCGSWTILSRVCEVCKSLNNGN
jgi:hypothetical protein